MPLISGINGGARGLDNSSFSSGAVDSLKDRLSKKVKTDAEKQEKVDRIVETLSDLEKSMSYQNLSADTLEKAMTPAIGQRRRMGLVDNNTAVFRYGMYSDNRINHYEDPIYIGFTMDIDTTFRSPFFNGQLSTFLSIWGKYNKELYQRVLLYEKFRNNIIQFLKSQESGPYFKSHYINTVSGLDKTLEKFVKPGDNFIEIEMYEDCGMNAGYLSYLYNNLTWSYTNGKAMIPKNLLRFDLQIKLSEIRNITAIRASYETDSAERQNAQNFLNAVRDNITMELITLHNCYFDFSGASNFGDSITVAGIGASMPSPAVLKFKIYYDSVSRYIRPALIDPGFEMHDRDESLGFVTGDSSNFEGDPEAVNSNITRKEFRRGSDGKSYVVEVPQSYRIIGNYNRLFVAANQRRHKTEFVEAQPKGEAAKGLEKAITASGISGGVEGAADKLKRTIKSEFGSRVKGYLDNRWLELRRRLKDEIDRKRAELIIRLEDAMASKIGISRIVPPNVYQGNPPLEEFTRGLASDIGFDILGGGKNRLNQLGKDATGRLFGDI
jgi:hypothetical protein